ncbi:hypothetical protein ATANTOWER_015631 [Ataeniobius toweri]|uniref:Uncharacterized protein n=1 Tax=Ataeniobius toweri TaxID=208326 RepID=A0ABU7AFN9_9TELE|nr:hypothetical protein [Ataeniobius toweri]
MTEQPLLKPGYLVRLRDISTGIWKQQGQVKEEVAPRTGSRWRMGCLCGGTTRICNYSRLEWTQLRRRFSRTQLSPQNHLTSELSTLAVDRQQYLSPTVERLSRPKRHIEPPKRLIESC